MSLTVYKYPLLMSSTVQQLYVPRGAKPISVKSQHGTFVVYCIVDTSVGGLMQPLEVLIAGTGHYLPPNIDQFEFFDTIPLFGGDEMYHVFMRR